METEFLLTISSAYGGRPCSDLVLMEAGGSPSLANARLPNGRLAVDRCLRVVGCETKNIFALGDVASHASAEPALAHTAEKQAICVLKSILSLISGSIALEYPETVAHAPEGPIIACVSLGPHEAMVSFNRLQLTDALGRRLGGVIKTMMEVTKMWQFGNQYAGIAFWRFADWSSVLLSRYLVRPERRNSSFQVI